MFAGRNSVFMSFVNLLVQCKKEEDIFEKLDMKYRRPEDRNS